MLAPPHKQQALSCPVREIDKTRSRTKHSADSIHAPFHYAHKLCHRGIGSGKTFSYDFAYVEIVTIFYAEISKIEKMQKMRIFMKGIHPMDNMAI